MTRQKNLHRLSDRRRGIRPWGEPFEKEPAMAKMIFVNLPVSDLPRATAFYQSIGAEKNPQFSDETASCMVFSDTIHVMLLTPDKFRQFTPKKIADAKTSSEVLICISADNRGAVDDMVNRAEAAGGAIDPGPKQDYGFMYGRSFEDPDGHIWEVMWMDVAAATAAQSAMANA
jgi:predicted lactoylglutathione lyase